MDLPATAFGEASEEAVRRIELHLEDNPIKQPTEPDPVDEAPNEFDLKEFEIYAFDFSMGDRIQQGEGDILDDDSSSHSFCGEQEEIR